MFVVILLETLSGIAAAPVAGTGFLAASAAAGLASCCFGGSSGGGSSHSCASTDVCKESVWTRWERRQMFKACMEMAENHNA